jgi:hypothetical protein
MPVTISLWAAAAFVVLTAFESWGAALVFFVIAGLSIWFA